MTGRTPIDRADKPARAALTCEDFEPFLFAYVDGEFDGLERSDADTHLATCERCRREVEAQRAFQRKLRESVSPAPAQLRANLMAALEREPAARAKRPLLSPRYGVPVALAAAASIALVFALRAGRDDDANALIAITLAHHQEDLPLDLRDAQVAHLREYLRGKVDFASSRIPEMRTASLPLQGVRLSHVNSRPAAYVAYGQPGQRRVSLLMFDAAGLRVPAGQRIGNHDVMVANQRGFNVVLWKDHEIAYTMVSDLDDQDIAELVAASAGPGGR